MVLCDGRHGVSLLTFWQVEGLDVVLQHHFYACDILGSRPMGLLQEFVRHLFELTKEEAQYTCLVQRLT